MYSCTIKTTEVASRKSGNRQDTGFARSEDTEKILSIERNDQKLHTDLVQEQRRRYEDRDVATNTVATAGILIQPVIQLKRELFVVFFEPQFEF